VYVKHTHTHTHTHTSNTWNRVIVNRKWYIHNTYLYIQYKFIVLWACVYTLLYGLVQQKTLSITLFYTPFAPPSPCQSQFTFRHRHITGRDVGNLTIQKPHSNCVRMYCTAWTNDSACQTKAFNAFSLITTITCIRHYCIVVRKILMRKKCIHKHNNICSI